MYIYALALLFVSGTLARSFEKRQLQHCRYNCPDSYSPVCGSDGTTYKNMCYYATAACLARDKHVSLRIVSHHACGGTNQINVDQAACEALCDEDKDPICASDGNVYANSCLFKRAECEAAKNNTRLSIVLKGDTCPTPQIPDCQQYHVDTSDIAVEGGAIKVTCPHGLHYVCGSDGHSYSSECQLCHHMETSQVNLTIAYTGVCHRSSV